MRKPLYRNRDGWILGQCLKCGRLNYVEPHGTTAGCFCSCPTWVEHRNIPSDCADPGRTHCIRKPMLEGASQ
jgi:hypothetical protein